MGRKRATGIQITRSLALGLMQEECGCYPSKALFVACIGGDFEMAAYLIREGADVGYREEERGGKTPLHAALREGHLDLARMLVGMFGADVTVTSDKR